MDEQNPTDFSELQELGAKVENIIKNQPIIDIWTYLELYGGERLDLLERIIHKIGLDRFLDSGGELVIDNTLPLSIGGWFGKNNADPTHRVMAINPSLLLTGTEAEIAHVLTHEGAHAGIYTEGEELDEESVVEAFTKKEMAKFYPGSEFATGYDQLVNELAPFISHLTLEQLIEVVEGGNAEAFENFVELVVLNPLLSQQPYQLDANSIQNSLMQSWETLRRLFPRMINAYDGRDAGVDAEPIMGWQNFPLDKLLQKAAAIIVQHGQWEGLQQGIMEIAKRDEVSFEEALNPSGYRYVYDYLVLQARQAQEQKLSEVRIYSLPSEQLAA